MHFRLGPKCFKLFFFFAFGTFIDTLVCCIRLVLQGMLVGVVQALLPSAAKELVAVEVGPAQKKKTH